MRYCIDQIKIHSYIYDRTELDTSSNRNGKTRRSDLDTSHHNKRPYVRGKAAGHDQEGRGGLQLNKIRGDDISSKIARGRRMDNGLSIISKW